MEQSMLKRLEVTKVRLQEVDKELCDENVMKDMRRFRDLSKERSNLEPVVEGYDKYLRIASDIKDAEAMINDQDPEIVELGHSEHKRLLEEEAKLCEELKILLLPKDPNDDKNIIVEGHGRWTVCKELGMERVPCIRLDHLTDEQRRAYALAHNKTAEMSSWLDDIVSGEISNIFKIDMKKFGFKVYNPFEGLEKPEDPEPEYPEDDNSYYGDERERSFNSMNLHEALLK